MHRYSLTTGLRFALATASALALSLALGATAAQAVVVDMNPGAHGQSSVNYPTDQSYYYGVALDPSVDGGPANALQTAGIPTVTSSAPCTDPALPSDLLLPSTGLCSHGGGVMHGNETFAMTWDASTIAPYRRYWQTTKNYVQQFLSDVATGSGTLTSPFADTTQYTDGGGRAANASVFGGGCTDYGNPGGYSCQFGDTNGSGTGTNYPGNGCTPSGDNTFYEYLSGAYSGPDSTVPNDICLTDSQIQGELSSMISQTGMLGHLKPGYSPLVVMLMPPGVVTCLDAAGTLCSANSTSTAQFCSYHGQVNVGGTEVPYVVQPWVGLWTWNDTGSNAQCVDPSAPQPPTNPPVQVLATDVGAQLVSPLSQAMMASIVNPGLNGWFALDGAEINDNGCIPFPNNLDSVTVGTSSQNPYFLQREFNNAGVIENEPNALSCTPNVLLSPTFVVPSAINQGDEVQLDGSTTASSLIVPKDDYQWNFGDGTTAVGPSVVHTYSTPGTFDVTLTVTDRGGNVESSTETIQVLTKGGSVYVPPSGPSGGGSGGTPSGPALTVRLQLMPQGLRSLLHSGLDLRVNSNARADGLVTVSIAKSAAKRAHIKTGRGPTVVIGRGTVSQLITNGAVTLHLKLSKSVASKLSKLGHVTLTVSLSLVAAGGHHVTIVAAGRY